MGLRRWSRWRRTRIGGGPVALASAIPDGPGVFGPPRDVPALRGWPDWAGRAQERPAYAGQREHSLREVFNGLRYAVKTGAPWRWMPNDHPPWEAVYQQAQRWLAGGCFEQLADDLRALLRLASGRHPEPSAAILDSRTLRSTPESGERAGYDGGKRKKGSKVHLAVDTLGHLLALHVTPADVDDRAQVGRLAEAVQATTGDSLDLAYVDQGYTGEKPAKAARQHGIELEVVKLPDAKRGFVLLPRRWVVERRTILPIRLSSGRLAFHASGGLTALEPIAPRF